MLSVYPAVFFKEKKGYSVVFPDLNWLATDGNSESDAMKNAVDCLAGYLYMLKKDGEKIPKPSSVNEISIKDVAIELDANDKNAFVNMVSVDVIEYAKKYFEKSVKKTLSIPAWLNLAAEEKHINFSQTLQEALIAKIRS